MILTYKFQEQDKEGFYRPGHYSADGAVSQHQNPFSDSSDNDH